MILENICKEYIKNGNKLEILKDINMDFKLNKLYLITGESGIGKTTLLNILGLLDKPTSGTLKINGKIIDSLKDEELSIIRKENIGMIFQNHYLNPRLTAKENVMLPLFLSDLDKEEKENLINEYFKKFKLDHRMNHFPKELSGGEAQRVCIIRSLVNNPNYILADEPTGNLDPKNAQMIYEILKDLSKNGKCVIVVSHDVNAYQYADIIYELKNQNLIRINNNENK